MMQFFLRTGYGESRTSFGSWSKKVANGMGLGNGLLQGMCQGNGAAPAAWELVVSSMLKAQKKQGHGGHYSSPLTGEKVHSAGITFVDDTYLVHKADHPQTEPEALADTQRAVTSWGRLLKVPGGALKPEKCFWWMARYLWGRDGSCILSASSQLPRPLRFWVYTSAHNESGQHNWRQWQAN